MAIFDLHDALLNNTSQAFWQVWNSKFRNKSPAVIQVNGTVDNCVIVNTFANYFASNCSPFIDCRYDTFKLQYQELRDTGSPIILRNLLISN